MKDEYMGQEKLKTEASRDEQVTEAVARAGAGSLDPRLPETIVLVLRDPVVISPPEVAKGSTRPGSKSLQGTIRVQDHVKIMVDWVARVVWLGWTYDGHGVSWAWVPFEGVQFGSCALERPAQS